MADTNDFIAQDESTPVKVAAAEEEWPRFSWPHMYLGGIGLAISLYAFLIHRRIMAGDPSGCRISETINCDKVLASPYGAIFGIPLGVFGMAYFLVVILSAVTTNRNTTPRQETTQRLVVASLGLCATAVLSYISYGILKAACPICMTTHAVIIVTFLVSLWQFLKVRKTAST
jgi:uncharacterized membrane protein